MKTATTTFQFYLDRTFYSVFLEFCVWNKKNCIIDEEKRARKSIRKGMNEQTNKQMEKSCAIEIERIETVMTV